MSSDQTFPGLVAHAGGGIGSATALGVGINEVVTVASSGDSVILPSALRGRIVTVVNAGANPMQVFGGGSDTINGVAGSTGYSQANGTSVTLTCPTNAKWYK